MIFEISLAVVQIENVRVVGKMSLKDVETSVKSHITDAHAHPCLFHSVLAKGRTAEESNLFKRPIVLIAKEQTRC